MKTNDNQELIDLLEKINTSDESSLSTIFDYVAKMLMSHFYIKKGKIEYDFLEIEFYYNGENHKDNTVYPRTCNAGDFFFHLSGLDIGLKSDINGSYGGILIRSLRRIDGNYFAGPLRCLNELMNNTLSFVGANKELPHLVFDSNNRAQANIWKTARYGVHEDEAKLYRYYAYDENNESEQWTGWKYEPDKKIVYYSNNAKPWNSKSEIKNVFKS